MYLLRTTCARKYSDFVCPFPTYIAVFFCLASATKQVPQMVALAGRPRSASLMVRLGYSGSYTEDESGVICLFCALSRLFAEVSAGELLGVKRLQLLVLWKAFCAAVGTLTIRNSHVAEIFQDRNTPQRSAAFTFRNAGRILERTREVPSAKTYCRGHLRRTWCFRLPTYSLRASAPASISARVVAAGMLPPTFVSTFWPYGVLLDFLLLLRTSHLWHYSTPAII